MVSSSYAPRLKDLSKHYRCTCLQQAVCCCLSNSGHTTSIDDLTLNFHTAHTYKRTQSFLHDTLFFNKLTLQGFLAHSSIFTAYERFSCYVIDSSLFSHNAVTTFLLGGGYLKGCRQRMRRHFENTSMTLIEQKQLPIPLSEG